MLFTFVRMSVCGVFDARSWTLMARWTMGMSRSLMLNTTISAWTADTMCCSGYLTYMDSPICLLVVNVSAQCKTDGTVTLLCTADGLLPSAGVRGIQVSSRHGHSGDCASAYTPTSSAHGSSAHVQEEDVAAVEAGLHAAAEHHHHLRPGSSAWWPKGVQGLRAASPGSGMRCLRVEGSAEQSRQWSSRPLPH